MVVLHTAVQFAVHKYRRLDAALEDQHGSLYEYTVHQQRPGRWFLC